MTDEAAAARRWPGHVLMRRSALGAAAGLASAALTGARAQGTPPLIVLGTGATETPIERIAHAFTARTGRAIETATGNGGQVAERIRAGAMVDVVLNAGPALDALIRDGFALGDSRHEMGRMRLAIAMRRGSVKPAITDEASLSALLPAAASR